MDTFIFDHVRTPRGKGRADGSLHEITPVWLASRPLVALAERNRLPTAAVEEVVMGCVGPVGEQGGNIGRIAVLAADWDQPCPRSPSTAPAVPASRPWPLRPPR
jgi:acetyl-CoA C-acetyltransferase